MSVENERFEALNMLYLCDTGWLRPGKSASAASGRDYNGEENRERFAKWVKEWALTTALDRIVKLEDKIADMELEQEANEAAKRG